MIIKVKLFLEDMLEIKKKLLSVSVIISLILFMSFSKQNNNCTDIDKNLQEKIFDETKKDIAYHQGVINDINTDTDWISNSMLFSSDAFIEIYENPYQYKVVSKELIKNKSISNRTKIIIILSMQKLAIEDYIEFIDLIPLSENDLLMYALLGAYENQNISNNFYRKDVRLFLKKINESNSTSKEIKILSSKIKNGNIFLENLILKLLK